ncbi:DUF6087 family protein [Kitasatospora sp. NPDC056138]|uniref:DUF6087 family protein n=1 Tax=Kitasatospora sp. NPDC056138 TaxID=3345724 RepID=UPI0035D52C9A
MDEDEPLELWAARREAVRRPVGELRATMLDGREHAAHVNPHAPRIILRWNGVEWIPETIADDYGAAQRFLHGITGDGVMRSMMPSARSKRPGRHRRT